MVKVTGALVAPEGTTTISWLKLTPLGAAAGTPPNFTDGVPTLKFAPVMVTLVPTGPKPGVKPKIVGWTTKLLVVWAELPGTINVNMPDCAPVGTATRIALLLSTVKSVARVLPNRIAVVPRKFVPNNITFVPERPANGAKPVITGCAKKLLVVVNVPFVAFTVIGPEVTPLGAWTVRL